MKFKSVFALWILFLAYANAGGEPLFVNDQDQVESRTVCASNDMEEMKKLDDAMNKMGMPIGNLRGGRLSCTGTLVDKDLFLTARHCKVSCSSMTVSFGYLGRDQQKFPCKEIVEAGESPTNQDYMLVRLEGNPGVQWGWYDMSDRDVEIGTKLLMIHHPGGTPMKVSRKNCSFKTEKNGLFYHDCDTNPGSSGSAILVPNYDNPELSRIVAVHTLGGCNSSSTKYNSGPSMKQIVKLSPTIKSMVK